VIGLHLSAKEEAKMQLTIRYSEAFKMQVVNDMETGRFRTQQEAMSYYGIQGSCTIASWCKKYGKNHLIPKRVRIETMNEIDRIEALQKEVKVLKKVLAETRVSQVMAEAYLRAFCDEFGITDIEAMKKKLDELLSRSA